jgi:hypothetical protein
VGPDGLRCRLDAFAWQAGGPAAFSRLTDPITIEANPRAYGCPPNVAGYSHDITASTEAPSGLAC